MLLGMMTVGSGFVTHRPPFTIVSSAANNSDKLRAQLDSLHSEANKTRIKANNARLRLMRLSEAAEKLRRQAAVDVRVGRENEARELLVQKRKVMQALEKSKSRIELLDKLSEKLNEAISVRESRLIGSIASGLEINSEDTASPVRIIFPKDELTASPIRILSPKEGISTETNEDNGFDPVSIEFDDGRELGLKKNYQANLPVGDNQGDSEGVLNVSTLNGDDKLNYRVNLDQQLDEVETELAMILRLSTLVLKSEQMQKDSKEQLMMEILQALRGIRAKFSVLNDR